MVHPGCSARASDSHRGFTKQYPSPPEDPIAWLLLTLCFAVEPADAYQEGLLLLSPDSTRLPAPKGIDWHAYTGSGAPLDTPAFYRTLGRDDDLVRHRRRQRNRWLASAGAIGLSTVGGALTSAYVLPEITDNGGLTAAGTAAGVWVAAHLPAFAIVPLLRTNSRRGRYPALRHSEQEAQAWVDAYNQALADELGLAPEEARELTEAARASTP